MKPTPTRFWLTDVKYLEEKRAIAVVFSQLETRRMVRKHFFPSFFAGKKILPIEALRKILSIEKTRFKLEEKKASFKVSASTFSQLQSLANVLFNETGFRPLVLMPERQFLLERQWSYFDCFTMASENCFEKGSRFSLPGTKLLFFSEPLHETIVHAAQAQQGLAEKILESIALSNCLRLPLASLPNSFFLQQEAFLENLFWKSGLAGKKQCQSGFSVQNARHRAASKGLAEVDFSLLWPMLLTKPFFNLGSDSIDCDCCKPQSLFEKNVLPNSLVEVEMQQDGFFFESSLASFSKRFHESTPARESRLRRMNEFCLNSVPVGPFFRFQTAAIPLVDALGLQAKKRARIVFPKQLHWFCLQRESLASKAIFSLSKSISLLERKLDEMRSNALREHAILGPSLLSTNPEFLLCQAFLKTASRLLCSLPGHLCNEKSAFFNKNLCSAIEAVEANTLNSFAKFAASRESRVVCLSESKAFLRSEKPYTLIKEFSKSQRVPALIRAKSR